MIQNDHTPETQQGKDMSELGSVWQRSSMGAGAWLAPQFVTLSDCDIDRIAAAVVRLLRAQEAPA